MITTNKPFRKLIWLNYKDDEEERKKEERRNDLDMKYNILTIGLDGYMNIYSIRDMKKIGGAAIQSSPIWDLKKIKKNEEIEDEESILNTHDGVLMSFDNGICSIIFIPHNSDDLSEPSIRMLPTIILKSSSTNRITCTQYQWSYRNNKMMITIWGGSMEGKLYKWDAEIPSMSDLNYYKYINNPTQVIDLPKRSIPWCIESSGEDEIIIGDSNGEVTVYDSKMGVQVQTLNHHKADILSMFIYDNHRLFTMGVDSSIVFYNKMDGGDGDDEIKSKWRYDSFIRPHTNDILTSSGTSSFLLTGGIDTKLFIHQLKQKNDDYLLYNPSDHHIHPYHGHEIAKLSYDNESDQNRYMLVHLGKDLQLWRLGKYIFNEDEDDEEEEEEEGGKGLRKNINGFFIEQKNLLLHIKTRKEISCFNISKETNAISYSDSESTFIVFIDLINNENDQQIVKKKIKLNHSSSSIEFNNNSSLFIRYISSNHQIEIYDIDYNNYNIKLNHIINNDPLSSSSSLLSVKNIKSSNDGRFISFYSYYSNNIYIYDLTTKSYHYIIHDFDDHNIPVSFGFDHLSKKLFVLTSSSKIFIYNIIKKRLSSWSNQYSQKLHQWIIKKVSSFKESLFNGSFNPYNNNQLLFYGNNFILFIDTSNNNNSKKKWKLIKEYNPLYLDYIDEKSVAIIEKPWISILQKLPQPFYRKRFGT